jgi:hypothetical protein
MYVIGGLIVGNPSDTREAIEANIEFARRYVDWPYMQHPTPYPGTPMTRDFRSRDLILSDRPEEYDGTTAVVRNDHLPGEEIEFLRWRAERWLKLRHFWPVVAHDPRFCVRHGPAMLRHTFRGSSWRSILGLESERNAFERYRALRRQEREYLPDLRRLPSIDDEHLTGDEAGERRRQKEDGGRDLVRPAEASQEDLAAGSLADLR